MTAKATPEAIRSIMRRPHIGPHKSPEKELNILTFCAHERYEQSLCNAGHEFYSFDFTGKLWDEDYGKIPDNYHPVQNIPTYIDFDLIFWHLAGDINVAKKIRDDLNIPIVLIVHTLPNINIDVPQQIKWFGELSHDIDKVVFISDFNRAAWGCSESNATYVEHGIDCDFWCDHEEQPRDNVCLSVVNNWPNRDWCCGWELWKDTIGAGTADQLPVRVFGKSPGYSEPAESIEHLRQMYHSARIFYNTSLHSPVPTVLMEAMACGCAVVSTETCMIPEIIKHGENGLISNDPQQLKKHLDTLLKDEEMAAELGKNAQKTIQEQYSLPSFVDNWNNLFYSAIREYKE